MMAPLELAALMIPSSLAMRWRKPSSEDGAATTTGLRIVWYVGFPLVAEDAERAHMRAPLVVHRGHRNHAHPLSLHENFFRLESRGVFLHQLNGCHVDRRVREVVNWPDPGIFLFKDKMARDKLDLIVRHKGVLHYVVVHPVRPDDSQLNVTLDLASS